MKIFKNKQPAPTPRRRLTDSTDASVEVARRRQNSSSAQTTFRRNSTITGSRSRSVRSASELDSQLQSPRAKTHHLRRRQRSLSAMFAGSMLAIVALAVLLQQFTASVSTPVYGQVGAGTPSTQVDYASTVQDYLSRRPAQRLRALLDDQSLVKYLQQSDHSEVSGVQSVEPDGFGATIITLKVREPVASWVVGGTKRYVDRRGTIFTKNYFAEPEVKIVDESGVDLNQDDGSVTSSRFLEFVGQAVGLLRDGSIDVREVIIPSTGTRQVEFRLSNKDKIKMTIGRGAGEQAEDAVRALEHLAGQRQSISYLDVRVDGQAFYR